MNWKKKHDIILRWIDSCETFEQLQNLAPFIKAQTFDNSSLLFMIHMKAYSIMAGVYVDTIKQIAKPYLR